ncbi:aspartate aminotransferase family protein [Bacillus carboniphilus]|uniref:Aspartate aminotransferase family protein n=1 Tax=Bacillus carboniphilus TaxID=86663 RepID=A0ABY9JVE2_9BACI|nr:aspartate aminotransferase family protein [Bacillus carboniphilus]WLR43369.1 aspartate aminotransferase family protein [Bacillus carboniphilus]
MSEIQKKDERYVWHSMKPYSPEKTMVVEKSSGSWIVDTEGNKYLDAMAGLWCVNIGYGREELARSAYEQLVDMPYYPLSQSHLPAIKLSEKLNQYLDDDYIIYFSNSGSEANEVAFKIARQYYQQIGEYSRYKFISRYRSYHGNTMGALSATGQAQRKYRYEPLTNGFIHVPPPDTYRDEEAQVQDPLQLSSVKAIDQTMTWELSETIAGVIMEPIITGGGILVPPEGYLKAVKETCEKHGALLIVDEVICGFGRTGKMFGYKHGNIKPDIITMAKGITSGYLPLAATAVRKDIYNAFKGKEMYDCFRHINTFGGNPAACALAFKNIEILEQESLVQESARKGQKLLEALKKELKDVQYVGDIRGKGLLIGIELVEDKITKKPLPVHFVNEIIEGCKKDGVLIAKNGLTVAGYNNVIVLSPPLSIEDHDLTLILETVSENVKKLDR